MSKGVYRDAWSLYKSRWKEIVRMAAMAYAGLAAIIALLIAVMGWYVVLPAMFIALTAIFWVEAPLAAVVADIRNGRTRSVRETFRGLSPHVNRITIAGILAAVGVYAGLYVLVVPGLILVTRWSMLVPVIVQENAPVFHAFARGRDLVRGHAWAVFWDITRASVLLVVSWIVASLIAGVLIAAFGVTNDITEGALWIVVCVVVLSLTTPLPCIAWALRYFALAYERPPGALEPSRVRVSEALDEAWALYKTRAAPLLVLGVIGAVVILGSWFGATWAGPWAIVIQVAATLVGFIWLQGLIAAGLEESEYTTGRRWLAAVARRAGPRVPALIVAGLIAGLVFATGIGIVLLIWWSALGPAVVVERLGLRASFGASRNLVSGRVRRVLGVLILSLLLAGAVTLVLYLFAIHPGPGWAYAIGFVAVALTAPYVALSWALMYRQLRRLEERSREAARAAPWE